MANANQAVIEQAKKDYEAAKKAGNKEGMEKAHAAAEAERAKEGYSGGTDGSQRISLASDNGGGNNGGSLGKTTAGGSSYTQAANQPKTQSSRYYTTVYTPTGEAVSGYIEGGKTYLSDGSRISDGYSVQSANGKWYQMQNGVGHETNLSNIVSGAAKNMAQNNVTAEYDAMEQKYQDMLAEIERQNNAITEAGVKQAVNTLNKQKDTVNDTMDQAAREAYISKMQSQKGLNEQYAAAGITGGPTESGRIALENTYANNITGINKQREASISDLDAAIADAKLNGDIAKAQNAANVAQQAAERYLDLARDRIALEKEVLKDADTEAEKQLQYYLTYIDAYADDPQAEIDRLMSQGVQATDPRVMALKALMNEIKAKQEEQARAATKYVVATATPASDSAGGGTSSAKGMTSFPAEDAATIKLFMSLHKTYNLQDVENDYENGFLTDKAYSVLKGALSGNSEDKAIIAEYSR